MPTTRLRPTRAQQLLALAAPVAEFPARTSGGSPVGSVVDASGNDWVLLSSGNIAEMSNSGGIVAQIQVPSYASLGAAPTGSELGLITYDAVDKNIWFYEANSNKFGMLNPASDAITDYPGPLQRRQSCHLSNHCRTRWRYLIHRARPE